MLFWNNPGIDISAHTFPCMEAKIIPMHTIVLEACVCMCVYMCVCYEHKGVVILQEHNLVSLNIAVCMLSHPVL